MKLLEYRSPFHYLAGVLCALGCIVHWVLSAVGMYLFIKYELNEDRYLRDEAYKDILEFMIGFFAGIVGLVIWTLGW